MSQIVYPSKAYSLQNYNFVIYDVHYEMIFFLCNLDYHVSKYYETIEKTSMLNANVRLFLNLHIFPS